MTYPKRTCTRCQGLRKELMLDVMGTPEIPCLACVGAPVRDFRHPFLLDTRQKVAWALAVEPDREYRLGDHSLYRPKQPMEGPAT